MEKIAIYFAEKRAGDGGLKAVQSFSKRSSIFVGIGVLKLYALCSLLAHFGWVSIVLVPGELCCSNEIFIAVIWASGRARLMTGASSPRRRPAHSASYPSAIFF